MHCVRKVTEDLYWVGSNDRRLELFENIFPIFVFVKTKKSAKFDDLSPFFA